MQSSMDEGTLAIGAESSVINIKENGKWVVKFVNNFPNNIIGQKNQTVNHQFLYTFQR